MHSHLLKLIVVTAVLLGCTGCKDDSGPTATRPADPTGTLTPPPLKAWVILHQADTGVGAIDNWGSRLTDQELKAYLRNVVKHASVFGTDAKFTWDEENPYTVVVLPLGPVKPADRRFPQNFIVSTLNGLALTAYDPNAINIYFSGYIPHPNDGPQEQTLAYTIDPAATGESDLQFHQPFILFNDGDWNIPEHHTPAPTDKLILEHEVGHYLIRSDELNLPYIQEHGKAMYDSQEHFIAWPSSVNTDNDKDEYKPLMKSGAYLPIFPVLDPASKENAYYRFYDNKWQQP